MSNKDSIDIAELGQILGQYLRIRSVRRGIFIGTIVLFIAIWTWGSKRQRVTSAIGCKNKLAHIIVPNFDERKKYIDTMEQDVFTLEDRYFQFITTTERMCYDQVHIGPSEDGGWDVCLDSRYEFKDPCLVYSFGIDNDFRFERGIQKLLGCEVHAFDPSMGLEDHQFSPNGYFYNIGIDNVDSYAVHNTWKMRRLKTIMKMLKHEGRTIDYLKMDIEFSEWPALYDMMESGVINQVRQLVMEVHTPEVDIHQKPDHHCTWSTRDTLAAMGHILMDLKNMGFSMYYTRTNYRTLFKSGLTGRERYCCYDIHMVNLKHQDNYWRRPS